MTFSSEDEESAPRRVSAPAAPGGVEPPRERTGRRWWILGVAACATGVVAVAIAVTLSATTSGSSPVSTTSIAAGSPSTTILPSETTEPAPPATTDAPTTAIGRTFNTFLDFNNPSVPDKVAVVEDGSELRQAIGEAVATPFADAAFGSRIDSSALLDSSQCALVSLPTPCAWVTYDVVGAKSAVILPGSLGYAVSVDGQWRVAKVTVCGLFELFYQASAKSGTPPGC